MPSEPQQRAIDVSDVERAQMAWADAVIELADALAEGDADVHQRAEERLSQLYDVDDDDESERRLLFLPETARMVRARTTLAEIVSYYVATNGACAEDCGFARRGWSDVCFENHHVVLHDARCASATGRYMLTSRDGESVTCDFVFSYVQRQGEDAPPRIRVHSSRLVSTDVNFV